MTRKIFWLDLETTGLDPAKDKILEVAVLEANFDRPFDTKSLGTWVLQTDGSEQMDTFVLKMHTKSGLLDECKRSSCTAAKAEGALLERVLPAFDRYERPVLAGSSVHFDMGFLRAHMPKLAARFTHQLFDVSAVWLFCRSVGMPLEKRTPAHRAHDDIVASVEHAKSCFRWLKGLS